MKCIAMLIIFTCNLFQYNNAVEKIPKCQIPSIFEAHLKKQGPPTSLDRAKFSQFLKISRKYSRDGALLTY